jgi:hypothetical protein
MKWLRLELELFVGFATTCFESSDESAQVFADGTVPPDWGA